MNASSSVTSQPLVTVIIPTYRQADVLGRAIDSALSQDYRNLEVVVADDASPDHTSAVVRARADSRLRYFRNERNVGRVANYRRALREYAQGEWVVNLDGDDYLTDPGFITAAVAMAQSDPRIVIVSARVRVQASTGDFATPERPEALVEGKHVALNLAREEYHFSHLATLYLRERALELDFYRMDVLSSDWESLYRLACHGYVAFLDRIVGVWCVGSGSASQTKDSAIVARNMRIFSSIARELIAAGVPTKTATRAMDEAAIAIAKVHVASFTRSGLFAACLRYICCMEGVRLWIKVRLLLHPGVLARLARALLTSTASDSRS